MKMKKQIMMFGADVQLERLSKLGDPLEKLNAAIDWEIFRAPIKKGYVLNLLLHIRKAALLLSLKYANNKLSTQPKKADTQRRLLQRRETADG